MEGGGIKAAGGYAVRGDGGGTSSSSWRMSSGGDDWRLENPFSFRMLQIFTGVGVGCGVGIGVGKPVYLGAIPALQQVLSATSGAMDVFSGAGRHVNSNLRRFGVKNLEAGIGCGIGIGYGFGVGIALKPGVIHKIQTCLGQAVTKIMAKFGTMPGTSAFQSGISDSVRSSADTVNRSYTRSAGTSVGNVLQLTTKPGGITSPNDESDRSDSVDSTHGFQGSKTASASSKMSMATRSERVISSFLHNPILNNDEEVKLDELVRKLHSENNMLQLLLKHQKVIDELMEENEKLRQILVEDLKVSPSRLQKNNEARMKFSNPCSDCIECRRKRSLR